jgi:Holliday junction resolvasome RuvABC endonuclease subunit
MTGKPLKILGINPGTRYLGIAVLYGQELMDWRVKAFKGKGTKEKAEKILEIISEQIELHGINTITIKKLHPARSSKNLAFLVSKIKVLAKRKIIKVHQYSIKELERFFLEDKKPNKKNLNEQIVAKYPVLIYELEKEKSHKNIYHLRMFEAVALASVCFRHLDE